MQRYRRNVVADRPCTPGHQDKATARQALYRLTIGDDDRVTPYPIKRDVPGPRIDCCRARIARQKLIVEQLSEDGLDPARDRELLSDLIELKNTLEKLRQQVCGRAAAQHVVSCRVPDRLRADRSDH